MSLNTLYKRKKQRVKKFYRMITLNIYYLCLLEGIVLTGGTKYLDYLLQKNYRYDHSLQNYETILKTGLLPNGVKIKKQSPEIKTVCEDFNTKWNKVLHNAEENLVEVLIYEYFKVIAKIQVKLDLKVRNIAPENYDHNYKKLKGALSGLR